MEPGCAIPCLGRPAPASSWSPTRRVGSARPTSTVNVAAALAQFGLRVLVIDLDPQGNASTAVNVAHHRGTPSTYDLLVEGAPLKDVVTPCLYVENLFVVPATIDLAGAEIELVSVVAREQRLDRALKASSLVGSAEEAGEDRYDFCFHRLPHPPWACSR